MYCPIVESSSSTTDRELWLMVFPESGSKSFQACHMEVCSVLFCSSYIPDIELVENRLYAYIADDSTLLAVVRKPADRPAAFAASLGMPPLLWYHMQHYYNALPYYGR